MIVIKHVCVCVCVCVCMCACICVRTCVVCLWWVGVFVRVFMHAQLFQVSSPVHTLHTAITHTGNAESHILIIIGILQFQYV